MQHGYVFDCIGLCICGQKIYLFSALPFEKILMCVLYYLIMEFKCIMLALWYAMPYLCIMQHVAGLLP